MIVVYGPTEAVESPVWQATLVFGVGLIGTSIVAALCRTHHATVANLPFAWDDVGVPREEAIANIETAVARQSTIRANDAQCRIAVVWSAGRSGFGATDADMMDELRNFKDALRIADRIFSRHPAAHHSFHLVSSAGGLFEGQTGVDNSTQPKPLRPYGQGKLEQERVLAGWETTATKCCYRPSSVFGFPIRGQRQGLIPTLIKNALRHTVTRIFGRIDTLRDYVSSTDVGRFIAEKTLAVENEDGVDLLASTRPTSLYELVAAAERTVGRKIYASYDPEPSNAAGNSYRSSALLQRWVPVDIETGMRSIYMRFLRR